MRERKETGRSCRLTHVLPPRLAGGAEAEAGQERGEQRPGGGGGDCREVREVKGEERPFPYVLKVLSSFVLQILTQ